MSLWQFVCMHGCTNMSLIFLFVFVRLFACMHACMHACRVSYSLSGVCPFRRVVRLPVSLQVQSSLQLRAQGLSFFPFSRINPQAILKTLFISGLCAEGLAAELGFGGGGAPRWGPQGGPTTGGPWGPHTDDEGAPRDPLAESDSEAQHFADGGALLGGPSTSSFAAASHASEVGGPLGGPPWGPPSSRSDGSFRGSVDSGLGAPGAPGPLGEQEGAPGAPLKHVFDNKDCIVCLDLINTAPIEFECWALGDKKGGPQRVTVGPHDGQSR